MSHLPHLHGRTAARRGIFEVLARISHQVSTAAADPGMSTALRSVGLLDVLSSTPAETSRRAPCSHARLRRLATKPGEKCGLVVFLLASLLLWTPPRPGPAVVKRFSPAFLTRLRSEAAQTGTATRCATGGLRRRT